MLRGAVSQAVAGLPESKGIKIKPGESVHADLRTVIELQQVDLKVQELAEQIDALPTQISALEAELHEFIHAHEERQKRLAANQKERKELEGDIQEIKEKISKHKDQLYQVKTNEQYRAMLKEIDGEEANIRKIEDQILEEMVEAEDLQKRVGEAAAKLESEKARVAAEVQRLKALRDDDARERDRLLARRQELQQALSEQVRELYERVRRGRRGVAVAEVCNGICTACNVGLRPQTYNEVRTNELLLTCDNCSRILYYVEPPPEETPEPGEKKPRATA